MSRQRTVRAGRGAIAGLLVAGWAAAGCDDVPGSFDQNDNALTASAPKVPADPAQTLGFEVPTAWKVTGTGTATTTRTQGAAALQVAVALKKGDSCAADHDIELTSAPVPSTAAALAGLGDSKSALAIDVLPPTLPQKPGSIGFLELSISSRSCRLERVNLGHVTFKGLRPGIYNTLTFDIPDRARRALGGAKFSDLVFELKVHVPGRPDQRPDTYLFDNLRVRSPSTPPAPAGAPVDLVARLDHEPPASTPGTANFPVGVVQIPRDFHLKLGRAGAGTATLELGFGGVPQVTCTYGPGTGGTSFVLSSCSNGAGAGDLTGADFARLTILGGDATAGPTKIRAQLALNPAGDKTGTGVLPPMPTYWGDTPASSNQIINDFFAAATAKRPTEEGWVRSPVPEFARRAGTGAPHDNLTGKAAPPNDPPFDQEGHMNPGNSNWDAYWRLAGQLSWDDNSANHKTLHFDSNLSAHAVVWGADISVVEFSSSIDTDTGEITKDGFGSAALPAFARGSAHGYVFGRELPGGSDSLTDFNSVVISDSIEYNAPPIQIWIFAITVGVDATVSLRAAGTMSPQGIDLTSWKPQAALGVHLTGGVNLGVASGGVEARIQLLAVSTPVQARAQWNVSTDPLSCSAALTYSLHGQAQLSTLGGSVDLVANLGICPFCLHAVQPIFSWEGIDLGTQALFDFDTASPEVVSLQPQVCKAGCVAYAGDHCGNCGTYACDGSCSDSAPAKFGEACQCGGTIDCSGRCNAGPADWGQRCNGCGATWACDGTCAGPQPACPPGWYTVANGNCELHQTTGLNLYEKDHPNFTFMTNLFNPKPLEGSYLALSYLRIDYNGGVCFDSDSPDAIQADCTNFSGALTQHDTGSNQSAEGRKYWNVGQSCDLTKLDWWTVFGRDTCNKYANLDAYWQIQPQCY